MTGLDKQMQPSDSAIVKFWQRIPVVIRAIVVGLLVAEIGIVVWLAVLAFTPGLWPIFLMGGVLWLYWKYFSGSWRPKTTVAARRSSARLGKLRAGVWKWGLAAAILFVVVVESGLVVTFRLIEFPAEAFTAEYSLDAIPLWAALLAGIMAALVAGICEETGFRGYMQLPLEKRYGPGVGITIVSIMFIVVHVHQAWALPILYFHLFAASVLLGILAYTSGSLIPGIIAHTVMDIINFSYWWSNVAGKFEKRPIGETGIDSHFLTWVLILGASIALFFWAVRRIAAVRKRM